MTPITPTSPESRSANIVADNLSQLKALFPEAFAEDSEGKDAVNFEVLKQLLGSAVDEREEKYGLNWHGKRKARELALTPSTGTLRPCPEDSVDWDTTQNLMIEGDNLEVLKLLQKSYAGKVKLIYIDPPYNTGKDFVYPDNFQDNIQNYLELVGKIKGGRKIEANIDASGRFHTDWLNMMYPRLKLARNLLKDAGVILVSIDDNESDRLKAICDEIFGPENYLVTLFVQVRYADKTLAEKNDYQKLIEQVLIYQKAQFTPIKEEEDYTIEKFCWKITELAKGEKLVLAGKNVTLFRDGEYRIEGLDPSVDLLKETWATGTVLKANASGKFFGDYLAPRKDIDGLGCIYRVEGIGDDGIGYRYFSGPKRADATKGKFYSGVPLERRQQLIDGNALKYKPILNMYDFSDSFGNCRHEGSIDFGSGKKPITFIKKLISICSRPGDDDLVLDFFAGSGSTGHAVWEQNQLDSGSRRFILVQLPEPIEGMEFSTISDLTKERLRRSGKKIAEENPMFKGDLGFRVFKLDSSNIRAWDPEPANLENALLDSVDHIKQGRSEADILYELLLKLGLDLAVPIETKKIGSKDVHAIGAGSLFVCLADKVKRDEVEDLALGIVAWRNMLNPAGEVTCVFRDSGFEDNVAKTNLSAILLQSGIGNVRSI